MPNVCWLQPQIMISLANARKAERKYYMLVLGIVCLHTDTQLEIYENMF